MPIKLVLDTSTIISAFFWRGNESELLKCIEQGKATCYLTKEILSELEDVINRPKFNQVMKNAGLTPAQIMQKIISLSHIIITPTIKINICRDVNDNKFLECAESAKADYIVSGDADLLTLKEFQGIPVVTTRKILLLLKDS